MNDHLSSEANALSDYREARDKSEAARVALRKQTGQSDGPGLWAAHLEAKALAEQKAVALADFLMAKEEAQWKAAKEQGRVEVAVPMPGTPRAKREFLKQWLLGNVMEPLIDGARTIDGVPVDMAFAIIDFAAVVAKSVGVTPKGWKEIGNACYRAAETYREFEWRKP